MYFSTDSSSLSALKQPLLIHACSRDEHFQEYVTDSKHFLRSRLDVTCSNARMASLVSFLVETGIEKAGGRPEEGVEIETKTEVSKAEGTGLCLNPCCSKCSPQTSGGISFTWSSVEMQNLLAHPRPNEYLPHFYQDVHVIHVYTEVREALGLFSITRCELWGRTLNPEQDHVSKCLSLLLP